MGKNFTLALQSEGLHRAEKNRTERAKIGTRHVLQPAHIGLALFGLLGFALLFYMFQINSFATKGYEIKQLENRISQLQDDHKRLEMQAAGLQSMQRIQSDNQIINMVPVTSISYIKTTSLSER